MKTIASIAVGFGLLAFLATPAFAAPAVVVDFAVGHDGHGGNIHEVHYDHGHHHGYAHYGYYGYPVARPWVTVPYVVSPPVVAYPPVYAAPRCYPYGAPAAGLYYRAPGISVGVGF